MKRGDSTGINSKDDHLFAFRDSLWVLGRSEATVDLTAIT